MRPYSPLGALTLGARIRPLRARRSVRPARDSTFVLSPRPGPCNSDNHWLLIAAPVSPQHPWWAPQKSALTIPYSSQRLMRRRPSELSSPVSVLDRPPDLRLKSPPRQILLR